MKASEAKLIQFLQKSFQFQIPIYQRTYSWSEKECRQLWDDIVRCGGNEGTDLHFIGSIVYIQEGVSLASHHAPFLVIDGQQRLTSVTLLLAAIADAAAESEPLDGFSQRKIRNYYLRNPEESGERFYKLLLSQTDKDSLIAIVGERAHPREPSLRITENFGLFKKWISEGNTDIATLCKGIAKLMVVDVALERGKDNPQLIFESMNSTGKELSQADLIRNFILMGLETELQTWLYEEFWRPMELEFGQEAYQAYFDPFMRHYLTVKTGEIPNVNEVYDAFKAHAQASGVGLGGDGEHVRALVRELREYSKYFCAMALGKDADPDLKRAFHDLRELKVDVAYPFLLELYQDYASGRLAKDELVRIVRLVEAYVFRRAVCTIPTNSMNKTFATFSKALKKERYLESVEAHFLLMPSYRRFPSDDEFKREIQVRDLYNFRSRSYWLRRFENFGRKEFVPVDEYTIEHIMPQNENLSGAWQAALGPDWKRVQDTWLHTLGNLTLTGYNSEYSDRPFAEKRDMKGGFKESPLVVNDGLSQVEEWSEEEIKRRAARLADRAVHVWTAPRLEAAVLDSYQPKRASSERYSIDDHPHLLSPGMQPVFDAFRKAVLGLDPCVTEEFLKRYVAYKAETNFVDIVPQARRLRLSLNMRFADVRDPKGLCKDVSGIGRWGNGEVEVGLATLDDLPYVMGLVRQSLEQQLGNGNGV